MKAQQLNGHCVFTKCTTSRQRTPYYEGKTISHRLLLRNQTSHKLTKPHPFVLAVNPHTGGAIIYLTTAQRYSSQNWTIATSVPLGLNVEPPAVVGLWTHRNSLMKGIVILINHQPIISRSLFLKSEEVPVIQEVIQGDPKSTAGKGTVWAGWPGFRSSVVITCPPKVITPAANLKTMNFFAFGNKRHFKPASLWSHRWNMELNMRSSFAKTWAVFFCKNLHKSLIF